MTNQRKQIIINEITFWKQNKLLPEHYCDFLMTLYTEGDHSDSEVKGNAKKAVMKKQRSAMKLRYMLIPLVALALIAAIYALSNALVIQVVAIVFGVVCLIYAIYFAKKNKALSPLLQLTGALVILFASFKMCLQYYPDNDTALYITLIGNCALWFISGLLLRLTYFTVAGALGLVAIIAYSVM